MYINKCQLLDYINQHYTNYIDFINEIDISEEEYNLMYREGKTNGLTGYKLYSFFSKINKSKIIFFEPSFPIRNEANK